MAELMERCHSVTWTEQVKLSSDVHLGVPSQCVVSKNAGIGFRLQRSRDQYIANVALKVNAKLGGVNNTICNSDNQVSRARN